MHGAFATSGDSRGDTRTTHRVGTQLEWQPVPQHQRGAERHLEGRSFLSFAAARATLNGPSLYSIFRKRRLPRALWPSWSRSTDTQRKQARARDDFCWEYAWPRSTCGVLPPRAPRRTSPAVRAPRGHRPRFIAESCAHEHDSMMIFWWA